MEVAFLMSISNKQVDEIELSAILNEYVYCDEQKSTYRNKSLYDIINMAPESSKIHKKFYNSLNEHPEWKNITLVSQSTVDGKISKDELIACTFKDVNGNLYVAYRGTGDGKWVDNGVAMANNDSLMQRRAGEYFDYVMEQKTITYNGDLIVTGHSKGGNSAQYVALTSKYANEIDSIYSIDGQGFSNKALENIKELRGEEFYNSQINKMYSINGHNDYVHELGNVIIKAENTILLNSTNGDGFAEWHELSGLFNKETGKLNFSYDADGNVISVEQGSFGKLAAELSHQIMTLDDEGLEDCTVSIMSILEMLMGDSKDINVKVGTGDIKTATIEEYCGLLQHGLPIIINTAVNSEHTLDVLKEFGVNSDIQILFAEIQNYVKENNIEDFASYISEDPLRLVEIYASMDLGKEVIHKAVVNVLSPENIAGFIKEHPIFSGVTVGALSVPVVREVLVTVASGIIAVGGIYLISKHVIANWDEIKADIIQGAEYVKDKVVEMYTALKNKLNEDLNNYAEDVLLNLERIITVGERFINKAVDQVSDFMGYLRDACKIAIKAAFFISNPILYAIASKIYNASREPVRINMVKLRQCVNTMNRLASRVASIDSRLDNLYYQLSRNNIEQGEGIFTSLANMYNLFRADLNVDEGQAIKRKARALSELFEDCEKTDKWVTSNVPQRI